MRTCSLVLMLAFASSTTGAPGANLPPPAYPARVGPAAASAAAESAVQDHALQEYERLPFAKSWVVRGGASRVTADGGGERESTSKSGGVGGKGQEVELALTGNFPNRSSSSLHRPLPPALLSNCGTQPSGYIAL